MSLLDLRHAKGAREVKAKHLVFSMAVGVVGVAGWQHSWILLLVMLCLVNFIYLTETRR